MEYMLHVLTITKPLEYSFHSLGRCIDEASSWLVLPKKIFKIKRVISSTMQQSELQIPLIDNQGTS